MCDSFVFTWLCVLHSCVSGLFLFFFFQAEDGIRDLVRSRGLGDVYKRQGLPRVEELFEARVAPKGEAVISKINGVVHLMQSLSLIHI